MVKKPNTDLYDRSMISETQLCEQLYCDPTFDYSRVALRDPSRYNAAIDRLFLSEPKLETLEEIAVDPVEWHESNQNIWFMPDEYKNMDIAKWLLEQAKHDTELQRTGKELLMYAERDMLDLLRYLKYLVDTLRHNNIVWGVGRGSTVASFVLYLIGVH